MAEKKIVYLLGAGATQSEMSFTGIEVDTTVEGINRSILSESRRHGGKYHEFHDRFALPPEIDTEQLMSFFEIVDESDPESIRDLRDELRTYYRNYLIEHIEEKEIEPILLTNLIHIHQNYGAYMGEDGEELLGILSLNFDSVAERAINTIYKGINLGIHFKSNVYERNELPPPLIKLHGSFCWQIKDTSLVISNEFLDKESLDFSGWITPSVYKKPFESGLFRDLWRQARALLSNCDILRVIGSSLRSEDFALISLLFTSQIVKEDPFEIQLVVSERTSVGDDTKNGIIERLNYLINMKPLSELIDISAIGRNVFHHWLLDKIYSIEIRHSEIGQDELITKTLFGVEEK